MDSSIAFKAAAYVGPNDGLFAVLGRFKGFNPAKSIVFSVMVPKDVAEKIIGMNPELKSTGEAGGKREEFADCFTTFDAGNGSKSQSISVVNTNNCPGHKRGYRNVCGTEFADLLAKKGLGLVSLKVKLPEGKKFGKLVAVYGKVDATDPVIPGEVLDIYNKEMAKVFGDWEVQIFAGLKEGVVNDIFDKVGSSNEADRIKKIIEAPVLIMLRGANYKNKYNRKVTPVLRGLLGDLAKFVFGPKKVARKRKVITAK